MNDLFFEYGYVAYFVAFGIGLNLLSPIILAAILVIRFGLQDLYNEMSTVEMPKSILTNRFRYFVPFYIVYTSIIFFVLSLKCKDANEVVRLKYENR